MYLKDRKTDEVAMRDAYCDTLIALAKEDDSLVAIEADVMASMGTKRFAKEFPERSINCGIQEANAVGVASGLALLGYRPFFHAFGIFATRRVFDQVFLSCGYAGANVCIIGGDAGVTASANGGTHMPFEDMSLMRSIPHMVVIEPTDTVCVRKILPEIATYPGSVYMRCSRKQMIRVYEDCAEFHVGGSNLLEDGTDVTIIASGLMVHEALLAAKALEKEGISAQVLDCYSIKPLDEKAVTECAYKTGAVVTAENHNVIGGLGSAVVEAIAKKYPVPVEMVGVKESFGEVGTVDYLQKRFGLTAEDIVLAAKKAIDRKNKKTRI